jgi:hypothetical protein
MKLQRRILSVCAVACLLVAWEITLAQERNREVEPLSDDLAIVQEQEQEPMDTRALAEGAADATEPCRNRHDPRPAERFREILSAEFLAVSLCIHEVPRAPRVFLDAVTLCRNRGARIATLEDLQYVYDNLRITFPELVPSYNPLNRWLGNVTGDNEALCGNSAVETVGDIPGFRFDFDGRCSRRLPNSRSFWCAHDPLVFPVFREKQE